MTNVAKLHPQPTFEDFWRVYPRKIGKPLAKAKWDAITNGGLSTRTLDRDSGQYVDIELKASPQEIIEGAERYRREQIDPSTGKLRDGGKYTCHPTTWLNRGRWMDEGDADESEDIGSVKVSVELARKYWLEHGNGAYALKVLDSNWPPAWALTVPKRWARENETPGQDTAGGTSETAVEEVGALGDAHLGDR